MVPGRELNHVLYIIGSEVFFKHHIHQLRLNELWEITTSPPSSCTEIVGNGTRLRPMPCICSGQKLLDDVASNHMDPPGSSGIGEGE